MQVKKKPIVYDAWELNNSETGRPDWVNEFINNGDLLYINDNNVWEIYTLEGTMRAHNRDILICGKYPNKIWAVQRDVFDEEYDIVSD
jgi:hypothetical protein